MEIIEKIKTNKSIDKLTEIQKICLDKLQSSPLPNPKSSQNTIRLIIGENCQIKLIKENYSIQQLSEDELDKYIKKQISCFDQNENWSDLLNLSLNCTKNTLGLKINGSEIPPIEIFSHASSNSLNA